MDRLFFFSSFLFFSPCCVVSVIGSTALTCLACGKATSYSALTTFVVSRHFITVTSEHKVASYNSNHQEN